MSALAVPDTGTDGNFWSVCAGRTVPKRQNRWELVHLGTGIPESVGSGSHVYREPEPEPLDIRRSEPICLKQYKRYGNRWRTVASKHRHGHINQQQRRIAK